MLEANAADLISRDGKIFVKGAEGKSVTVSDVARARLFRHNGAPIVGSGSFDADSVLPDSTRFGNESGAYNYGAQAAASARRSGNRPGAKFCNSSSPRTAAR